MSTRTAVTLIFLCLLSLLVVACEEAGDEEAELTPEATLRRVQLYENPEALDIYYPAAWTYDESPGLLEFGEPERLEGNLPGASLIIRRSEQAPEGGLEAAFQLFLLQGPISGGYEIEGEMEETLLARREAREAFLTRPASDTLPAYRGYIISTITAGGTIYHFFANAPVEEWDEVWPEFQFMLESLRFNE